MSEASETPKKRQKLALGANEDTIVGYIHDVSPVKLSNANNRFFEATLQTENEYHKVIFMSPEKRNLLTNIAKDHTALKLTNIRKDLNYQNPSKFDILANSKTATLFTEVKYAYTPPPKPTQISIQEVKTEGAIGQNVSVEAKVITNDTPERKNIKGQTVMLLNTTIADKTSSIKLAVWGSDIPNIVIGKSFKFVNLTVKEFNGKYLSMSKRSTYEEIQDIGYIKESEITDERNQIEGTVEMVSVSSTYLCASCFKAIVKQETPFIKCTSCGMKQKTNHLKHNMTMNIKLENNTTKYIASMAQITSYLKKQNKEDLPNPDDLEDYMLSQNNLKFYAVNNRITDFI